MYGAIGALSLSLMSLTWALPTSNAVNKFVGFDLYKSRKHDNDAVKLSGFQNASLVGAELANEQFYYQIELDIGTPAQKLNFTIDTGSSDLWVMDLSNPYCTTNSSNVTGVDCSGSVFIPELSSTFHNLGTPFSVGYGDGTFANGTMASDTVRVGDNTIVNATFAVANVSNSTTCVFGIGLIGDEADSHVHRNGSGVYPTYFNVPTLMKEQNLINTNAYSLWLNGASSDAGSILFGAIDKSKYEGQLTLVPMFNNYHEYSDRPIQTRVMLNGISADNSPLVTFDIAVLLDSGSSFSYLPSEIVDQVGSALGFSYDDVAGYYYGGTDTAKLNIKQLNLDFSGAIIDVGIENLLVGLTLDDGVTPVTLNGEQLAILAMSKADSSYDYILGDVFLRSMYAVFDIDHYEIALANARVNATDSDIDVIGAIIPDAVQAPRYFHTTTNNASFSCYPFTPVTSISTTVEKTHTVDVTKSQTVCPSSTTALDPTLLPTEMLSTSFSTSVLTSVSTLLSTIAATSTILETSVVTSLSTLLSTTTIASVVTPAAMSLGTTTDEPTTTITSTEYLTMTTSYVSNASDADSITTTIYELSSTNRVAPSIGSETPIVSLPFSEVTGTVSTISETLSIFTTNTVRTTSDLSNHSPFVTVSLTPELSIATAEKPTAATAASSFLLSNEPSVTTIFTTLETTLVCPASTPTVYSILPIETSQVSSSTSGYPETSVKTPLIKPLATAAHSNPRAEVLHTTYTLSDTTAVAAVAASMRAVAASLSSPLHHEAVELYDVPHECVNLYEPYVDHQYKHSPDIWVTNPSSEYGNFAKNRKGVRYEDYYAYNNVNGDRRRKLHSDLHQNLNYHGLQ